MHKKRIFISSRIEEMRPFREAAIKAIKKAGMQPLYYDSTDPKKHWPIKLGIPVITQLLKLSPQPMLLSVYMDIL